MARYNLSSQYKVLQVLSRERYAPCVVSLYYSICEWCSRITQMFIHIMCTHFPTHNIQYTSAQHTCTCSYPLHCAGALVCTVCASMHIHAWLSICVHMLCVWEHKYMCMHVCVIACLCVYIVHVYACICYCILACCVCMHIHVCVCSWMYIQVFECTFL